MDVRAILLLGPASHPNAPESLGGVPLALLDVLGRPVVQRIADRLRRHGVSEITVIGDIGAAAGRFVPRALSTDLAWMPSPGPMLWRVAQRVFSAYAQDGVDLAIIVRLGPYTELDYDQLIQVHLDRNGRVTAATAANGELLGTFVISTSRRNDASFLLRHRLQEGRMPFISYKFTGYSNPLASAADLRRLAIDTFRGRANATPAGTQIRPGVWVAGGARIQRGARVLAPAFIGEHAKVRASAVVTRCSVLEHHTAVDCGSVVENATILPYTTVGAGLDVCNAVVGFGKVTSLKRQVEVEVTDPKLVGSLLSAPVRILGQAAALAAYLPVNFFRGLLGRPVSQPDLPVAVQAPSAALSAADPLPAATDSAVTNFR